LKLIGGHAVKHEFKVPGRYYPNNPGVIVFESKPPHWGFVHSMEFIVYRDGTPAQDVATNNIGIKEYGDACELRLQFECFDCNAGKVGDHAYEMHGTVNFYELGDV